ncbi:SDR family NAD(P)-dependent oxidoreductase [Actinoallomurus iriomotensis]|uniref:Short-chain dehydrogenase n=1 Tax=Actinoallomurus iriomotensis TaxID=478107 RepID=A0A9W6RUN7_9ACTN|nr:SDR family NAD(P)-dependent oxidoreductase [Actinoallomurus iriomotensis]GLY82159.1 short-chain dehydrogenase [Actinoallomurus iriomotensis]
MTRPTAVVTGAARGIGAAVVEALVRDGFDVVAVDRDQDGLRRFTGTANVRAVTADATDATAMAGVVGAGPIAALVNNAAAYRRGALHESSAEDWQATLAGVLKPVEAATRAVLPAMLRSRSGSIVNVASVNGLVGNPGHAAYTAAKGAVHALTRQLAVEYGPHGIRVNSVSPGLVLPEGEDGPDDAVDRALLVEPYPLGRVGRPDDVAEAVAFLAGSRSAFVTGVDLPVDGGLVVTSPAAVVSTGLRAAWHRPPLHYRDDPRRQEDT